MPRDITQDDAVVLRFGGGLNTRASEDEIDLREAAGGKNFDLDLQNRTLRNRRPFDLVGTVPNGAEIRGFVALQKTDGAVSMLVQAGASVYSWDGANFVLVGTVSPSARLRGRLSAFWPLDDLVIVTDLALAEEVYSWDGSAFTQINFFKNDELTPWTGDFRARYCVIENERAIFASIHDNGSDFPHMIVGSKTSDYRIISNDKKPSSALGDDDPFFLLQPDLRPINGLVGAFGMLVTSSQAGAMFKIAGSSARDFRVDALYPRSGASGLESVVYVGNDIHYGRIGRIESLASTDRFGDVETDDLTDLVSDQISDVTQWTGVYNERVQRVYWLPSDGSNRLWVMHKSLLGSDLSPWVLWDTRHESSMAFTAVMNALDPSDGLEYVFAGDASGNLYRLEGVDAGLDAGTSLIRTEHLSGLFKAPLDAMAYDIEGWILFRKKGTSVSVTLRFEFSGESVFNEEITETLTTDTSGIFWGGDWYFGGDAFWGAPFAGRLTRRKFGVAGRSNEFQLRIIAESGADFEIVEVGMRFAAASQT